jgi:hypothetical protein
MRSFAPLFAFTLLSACAPGPTEDDLFAFDDGAGGDASGSAESCRPGETREIQPMTPPADVSPGDTEGFCLALPFGELVDLVPGAPRALGDLDAKLLVNEDCLGVDTPSALKFVAGVALKQDTSGTDYAGDFAFPLPERIQGVSLPRVPEGTTLVVAKVSEFQDRRVLRLVNIATVRTDPDSGARVLSTLTDLAAENMSGAMRIDGPGLFGVFMSKEPLAFVSGRVTLGGEGVSEALVTATEAPFMTFTDADGAYTIASLRGEAGFVGYDLESGATGQAFLPVESADAVNPKTGEPAETPAIEAPVAEIDALNLTGVEIVLTPVEAEPPPAPANNPNLDFESGTLSPWEGAGDVSVLDTDYGMHFAAASERRFAFISSGAGSVGGARSALVRTFEVPAGKTKLHLRYSFVSQEYPAWLESSFNDLFVVYRAGETRFLVSESVQSNADDWQDHFAPLGNVGESEAEVGDVLHRFGGRLGQREASLDVGACAGGKVRLVFAVTDIGDRIYDSAALIDAVWFE